MYHIESTDDESHIGAHTDAKQHQNHDNDLACVCDGNDVYKIYLDIYNVFHLKELSSLAPQLLKTDVLKKRKYTAVKLTTRTER